MELQRSNGKGWVLFGAVNGDLANWFERWFASEAQAIAFAARKGWIVQVKG